MKKYKLVIEYDGSAYLGWQSQLNGGSIQEVMETCLKRITKVKTNLIASGRTDAGVHAEAQIAHFVTRSKMTSLQFLKALNSLLPHDIVIKEVGEVPLSFNARGDAQKKIYRYTILNRDYPTALDYRRVWFVPHKLNLSVMQRAARYLVGNHDFRSFQAAKCSSRNPVKKIFKIDFMIKDDLVHIQFEGSGFLKHMVRNLVGTLVWVGKGKFKPEEVREILESRDRKRAGPTAPPQGLCLVKVFYPEAIE